MRVLWKGYIAFGLINIPIRLHSADKGTDLHFKLLDARDKSKIRFERINEHTGEEVPWNKIVKAYQFSKDNYVIVKDEKVAPRNSTSIALEGFVNSNEINLIYLDKPYYLIPDGNNPYAFVLFREVLRRTNKIGIAKIMIRAREHIAAIYPYQNVLVLQLLRFSQELIKVSEFEFPEVNLDLKQLNPREIDLAEKLIEHMTQHWRPEKYHDESREKMLALIKKQIKKEKFVELPEEKPKPIKESADVISLLEKSLPKRRRAHGRQR